MSRRCSADESTGQSDTPRSGVKLGSSCIRTATARAEKARQRPVSTGEHKNVFLGQVCAKYYGMCYQNILSLVVVTIVIILTS